MSYLSKEPSSLDLNDDLRELVRAAQRKLHIVELRAIHAFFVSFRAFEIDYFTIVDKFVELYERKSVAPNTFLAATVRELKATVSEMRYKSLRTFPFDPQFRQKRAISAINETSSGEE